MTNIQEKFDLTGKVAIVTGGIGLLGSEFCRTLGEAGAAVVVADLDGEKAHQLAKSLGEMGLIARGVGVDVTRPESVAAMVDETVHIYGQLDVLVNSAAMDPKFDQEHASQQAANAFETFPLEAWNQALNVNLTGAFLCCQAAARAMLKQGSGALINICSTYGLVGPDQRIYQKPGQEFQSYKPVYYTVTKSGILGLTKYLATYYAGKGIRANALTPGGVYNNHDDTFTRNYSARTVIGRMAHKDEMNGALLFLASDASSYMTGSNLVVDGGWTAW
jgi:NAD(P)-dependent dehydrogenase (short-subunit alcohol dehydrogenase family)